ncbi:protein O-mannose kinase-like [Styela clava]
MNGHHWRSIGTQFNILESIGQVKNTMIAMSSPYERELNTSPTKKLNVFEGIRYLSGFLCRRFRNALLIILISLFFILIHCNIENKWTQKYAPTKVSVNNLKKRTFGRAILTREHIMSATRNDSFSTKSVFITSTKPRNTLSQKFKHSPQRGNSDEITLSAVSSAPVLRSATIESTTKRSNVEYTSLSSTEIKSNTETKVSSKYEVNDKKYHKNWLTAYTTGLPENLHYLLETLLLRDFAVGDNFSVSTDDRTNRVPPCKRGYFRLNGMRSCHKWLQCEETSKIVGDELYGSGVGKIIQAAKWRNMYDVAVVSLRKDRIKYKWFVRRVQSGVNNMLMVQPSPYATQVVGYCEKGNTTVMVMEACKQGNFRSFYCGGKFRQLPVIQKFQFAIQMVAQFDYLHRGLGLPRVHCDLHTVMQAFGQYVVSNDGRLFLSDLDEIPQINRENNSFPTCECEPMGIMSQPEFLAPEIRYTQLEFNDGVSRKPVTEAADVWKIPDLTANILFSVKGHRSFEIYKLMEYHLSPDLQEIHDKCKKRNPNDRPNSREVLIRYLEVYEKLLKDKRKR